MGEVTFHSTYTLLYSLDFNHAHVSPLNGFQVIMHYSPCATRAMMAAGYRSQASEVQVPAHP